MFEITFYILILTTFYNIIETPKISVSCPSVHTVNQSDYFACECKGTNANLPADVTWDKNSKQIVTGKEKAILVPNNVDKDDSGTYRCEARNREKAKRETSIELIVIRKYIDAHVALVSQ